EARGQAPFQLRRRLRNGGRGNGRRGQAATRGLEGVTTFHHVTCSVSSPREAGSPPPSFLSRSTARKTKHPSLPGARAKGAAPATVAALRRAALRRAAGCES